MYSLEKAPVWLTGAFSCLKADAKHPGTIVSMTDLEFRMNDNVTVPQGMSARDEMILKLAASGKTTRAIASEVHLSEQEIREKLNHLLDVEVNTDIEFKRKLQVFRLEQIINALWDRVMSIAERDDVKNLILTLEKLDTLLALNKENDLRLQLQIKEFQSQIYLASLQHIMENFKALAPDIMSEHEWAAWTIEQLRDASNKMSAEIGRAHV